MCALRILVSLVLALAIGASAPLAAHHSFAMYDSANQIKLDGVVKELQWSNPHVWIQIVVANDKGGTDEWGVECTSVNFMIRRGWTKHTLRAGDKINVTISPLRDGAKGGSFRAVNSLNGAPLKLEVEE
jgi:hypothetical protein